jgi:PAB1-binding protein PBP1
MEKKEINWKEKYDQGKKRVKELENSLSISLNITEQQQLSLDKVGRENNNLYNKIADLTESLKSKDYFEKPDYQYLIDENRKLEEERNELLTDNKKLAAQIEDKIDQIRKSGM